MAPNIVILPAQQNKIVTGAPRPLRHPLIVPNTQRRIAVPTSTSCQPRIIPIATSASRKRQTSNVLVAPKPSKRPAAPTGSVDLNSITELLSDDTAHQPVIPRKRQNLNHLSSEERQQRRMMMNRVAAQTARDRKKARSEKLEEAVKHLISETRYLRGRVAHLEQKLSEANAVIARNGGGLPSPTVAVSVDSQDTIGSAASICGPLPWERVSEDQQVWLPDVEPSKSSIKAMKQRHFLITLLTILSTLIPNSRLTNRCSLKNSKKLQTTSTSTSSVTIFSKTASQTSKALRRRQLIRIITLLKKFKQKRSIPI